MKVYRKEENSTIYGSNRWIEIRYNQKGNQYFNYRKSRYYLSDFMKLDNNSEFHGHLTLTNTSTILVKLSDCGESIKAFLVC